MLAHARDEMVCDLAETYHILNYRALPVDLLATLVFGLREDSRIKATQIVVIAPLPSSPTNPFTTQYAGGWTLEQFNTVVGSVCKKNKIGFVDWAECSMTAVWGTAIAGALGNYAHPKDTFRYRALGNYAAGRVAYYCKAF